MIEMRTHDSENAHTATLTSKSQGPISVLVKVLVLNYAQTFILRLDNQWDIDGAGEGVDSIPFAISVDA